jgi:hypothetical protein
MRLSTNRLVLIAPLFVSASSPNVTTPDETVITRKLPKFSL